MISDQVQAAEVQCTVDSFPPAQSTSIVVGEQQVAVTIAVEVGKAKAVGAFHIVQQYLAPTEPPVLVFIPEEAVYSHSPYIDKAEGNIIVPVLVHILEDNGGIRGDNLNGVVSEPATDGLYPQQVRNIPVGGADDVEVAISIHIGEGSGGRAALAQAEVFGWAEILGGEFAQAENGQK